MVEHPAAPDLVSAITLLDLRYVTHTAPDRLLTDYPDQQLVDLVTAIRTGREPVVNEDYNDWRNDEAQGGSWITLTKQANGTR